MYISPQGVNWLERGLLFPFPFACFTHLLYCLPRPGLACCPGLALLGLQCTYAFLCSSENMMKTKKKFACLSPFFVFVDVLWKWWWKKGRLGPDRTIESMYRITLDHKSKRNGFSKSILRKLLNRIMWWWRWGWLNRKLADLVGSYNQIYFFQKKKTSFVE